MPKAKTVTREEALSAAAEVVRKGRSLNVRAVAKELNCSTQPVYSLFGSMEALKAALFEEGRARYHRFIEEFLEKAGRSRYECFGMGFVKFAREEKGLFRYLFLRTDGGGSADPFLDEILAEMVSLYRITEAQARAFHADMAVFSYGLAVLVNAGACDPSDEEISQCLKREFYGLYAVHFPERPPLNA